MTRDSLLARALARSMFGLAIAASTMFVLGCGGSSSETPFPLPPHPLHEPYRERRVAASRPAPESEPEASAEKESDASGAERSDSDAQSTWGERPNAPAPAPE